MESSFKNFEKVTDSLESFGLERCAAMVYCRLLQNGSETIGSLAKKSGIDRGKTYRIIEHLRNSGVVVTTFSNPTICSPILPKKALKNIIQRKEEEFVNLKKIENEVVQDLQSFTNKQKKENVPYFSIIQGRLNIYTTIGNFLEAAEDSVYIVTTVDDLLRMYHTTLPEKIKGCLERGLQIRIITQTSNYDLASLIKRFAVTEMRLGKLPSESRIIVEKGSQLIMSGYFDHEMNSRSSRDSVMTTDSRAIILNMYTLCNVLWKKI